jgi:hypothetical protein
MALFDEEHRKWQEENGRKLRERLRKTVAKGFRSGEMEAIGFSFAKNLLNNLERSDEQKRASQASK